MKLFYPIIEFIFAFALFINALLFIPQILLILKKKTSEGVALTTFLGFLLIQLSIVLHGYIHQDTMLIYGYLFSMCVCGILVGLIFFYRKPKQSSQNPIDFESIINQLPGNIYWKDRQGTMVYCNKASLELCGFESLSEYQGKNDFEVFPKEVAEMLWRTDEEVMRTGKIKIVEEIDPNAIGGPRVFLSHKVPLRDKNLNIIGILGVSLDITEAKRSNIEHLEMLNNIIALMPGHVYWVNREGIYMGCNDNQAKSAGLSSRKDIVGMRNKDLPWNFNMTTLPEALDKVNQEVMQSGKTITLEEKGVGSDGSEETYLSNKVPIRNQKGNIIGMVGISVNITNIKKTERELILSKEAAEAANIAKTTFLYNMQHDLRTPFSGILGIAEFMQASETDPEKKVKLGYISQSASVLLDHLNQIFEAVHLESGQVPLLEKQFNLLTLIVNTYKMMLSASENKKLDLIVQQSEDLPEYVIGDKIRLQSVLINLLSNAIKFTHKGYVKLFIRLLKKEERSVIIKFVVEDTGIGIPEDKQNLIFEQFNRITGSYSGIYPGKGLGLRLVKRALDEMGGEVYLDSQPGKGSVFKVLVPFKKTLINCPENECEYEQS